MVQFLFYISWEQRKLKSMTSVITKGTTPLDKSNTGNVNFIKIENINNFSGEISITQRISAVEHEGYLRRSKLKENDILFSIAGTLGRVTAIKASILPANTNQAVAIIRLKEGVLNYIKTFLKGKAVVDFIRKNPTVGAQPNLSLEQVGALEIQVPDIQEQTAIGDFFEQLDNLITLHQCEYFLCSYKNVYLHLQQSINKITNSWEQRKLGEVTKINMGQSPAGVNYTANPNDAILVQGNADMVDGWVCPRVYTRQITKKAHVGDLIFSVRAPVGEVGKTQYDVVIGRGVAAISGNEYIFQTLKQMNAFGYWTKLSAGSTFESINSDTLKSAKLFVPKENEQRKIGEILLKIDNLITLHQCEYFLCSYKYVYLHLQQSISKKTNSWEQRKLGEMVNEVTRTDPESNAPIMMITANNGFIEQSDRYAFDNAGESLKKYILLEKGELAYNHGASKLRPYGSCFALTTVEKARIPFVYHCFSAKNQNSEFLSIELNSDNVEKQLRRIVSSGARMDGLLNISFTEYSTVELSLPKTEEQDKISYCFRMFDNLITLHQRKLKDFYGGFL